MCCSDLQRIYTANFSCHGRIRFIVTRIGNLSDEYSRNQVFAERLVLISCWKSTTKNGFQSLSRHLIKICFWISIVIAFSIKRNEKRYFIVLDFFVWNFRDSVSVFCKLPLSDLNTYSHLRHTHKSHIQRTNGSLKYTFVHWFSSKRTHGFFELKVKFVLAMRFKLCYPFPP